MDIYFPTNWGWADIRRWAKERNIRLGIIRAQYYPKGIKKTKWEEIIWGLRGYPRD